MSLCSNAQRPQILLDCSCQESQSTRSLVKAVCSFLGPEGEREILGGLYLLLAKLLLGLPSGEFPAKVTVFTRFSSVTDGKRPSSWSCALCPGPWVASFLTHRSWSVLCWILEGNPLKISRVFHAAPFLQYSGKNELSWNFLCGENFNYSVKIPLEFSVYSCYFW